MKRFRTKTGASLLIAVFLLLLINTDVRAALFSGVSFLGHSLADEFNRIFVNTLDSRAISEKELPVIKPVEKEEKGVEEFSPLKNAELVSAVNNNSADRPILAAPITPASYSVSGGDVRYNSDAGEPGEITGSMPTEEETITNENVNAQEELQLEETKSQEELLKQLLAAAEENLAAAGQTETGAAKTEDVSVIGAAPAEQTNTAAEDAYTKHLNAVAAIDNVKQLLSARGQGTSAAQSSAYSSEGEMSVPESASSRQTSASVSVSGPQGSGVQEAGSSAESEGYDGVCYNSLTDLEERINNVGKIAGESLSAMDGASSLSDNPYYSSSDDTAADVSASSELSSDSGDTGENLTALEKKLNELETRVDELEKEVYGVTYGDGTYSSTDTSDMAQLEQRLAKLEARVTVLESVMKDVKDALNNILNNGSSEPADDSSSVGGDASAEVDDALVADIEKRLAEFMGGTTEEGVVTEGGFAKIELAETKEGYIFCSYDQQDNIQPFLLLGGAAQCAGEDQISLYYDNFLPLVAPVALIADQLINNGHNCIKIYLPPDNLTASDAQDLAQFIQELYIYYNIRTYILHFAGLYASSEEEFLLNNPTKENLGQVTKLVQEFAQWVKDLGPAAAGVQLGNENEYYVKDAGVFYFTDGEWNTINLSADAYYAFMNELAGVYKQIDPAHPVFLGHGELDSGQIPLLKNHLANFDGIAVNTYYNWDEEHKFFKTTMPKEKLEKYFTGQVETAAALHKPLIISEFSETSYGDLGESGQKEFADNITEVLGKFMIGSDSAQAHIVAGLFWYEYFPEYWKDEIHPSQSGMALFDVVDDQLVAKEAFAGLSQGYQAINKNLQKLISDVTGEESGQDNNTTVAEADTADPIQETEESVPARETGENELDKDDSGRVITLKQGEELTVSLSSNPTTGYEWDIYGVDKSILELEGTNHEVSDAAQGLVGAGGTTTFCLRAVKSGVTTLVLTYRRPWLEDEYSGIFYVTVFVK